MKRFKRNSKNKAKSKSKGVATIEFVLGFMGFWLMCMAWVEMSYMSYVSAVGDLAVAEAARESKTAGDEDNPQYLAKFREVINSSDALWAGLVDTSNFRLTVQHLADQDALNKFEDFCVIEDDDGEEATEVECDAQPNMAIAIYRIDYDFNFMFTYFIDTTSVFSREVIVIQEYEREAFNL
ncbi:pilus assembly protein TadE [Vibrio sp. 10N.286.49.B3]|uniref:TadE family protein n=1 Tax=Vibrio sp. 10N.286.49.B3 TaxID=1880855 RepID=UPI000C867B72|nr:TadE family protein [Vibrio sp. 10N.286.49.B3]PMH46702.1 pilus assembly protein TadE [Vibrio sp. 10N.286.49.B3]